MVSRIVGVFMLSALLAARVQAQEVAGSISGRVLDSTGAALAGAAVTALHPATATSRQAATDEEGMFVFRALPIGMYQISVARPGFKKLLREGVELHIGDHLNLPLTLEVGDLAQEVSVVADAAQVQTESSEQSGLISGEQVRELQLNGRSFMTLVELLPGVSSDMPDRSDPNSNPTMSINGARSSASSFNIDGGNNADLIVGSSSLNTFTSVDTIAEVKVITSTFAAEYGRGGFSQVNVVTRGGTRRYAGSLYEFFRNDALDARDYFSHQVLPLKLNNFGYNFGGPVMLGSYNRDRKKTFFFFTQEFNLISTRGEAVTTTVPQPAERLGNFSARGAGADRIFGTTDDPIIDPVTGRGFPDGILPQARIDPNAVKLLSLYPLPNATGPGAVNYVSAAPSRQNWREELIRLDHNFSAAWKVFGRFVQDSAYIDNPYGGSGIRSITTRFPGLAATKSTNPGKNFVLSLTSIFGPRLLNEMSATYAARGFSMRSVNQSVTRDSLGLTIPEIFPENDGRIIPVITPGSGFAALSIPRPGRKQLYNVELSDNVTLIRGAHTLKAGVYYTEGGNWEQQFSANTSGTFTFTTAGSRNAISNILLGLPTTYSENERTLVSHLRYTMFEAFAQDDFKVTPRFTLNYGLRYSAYFNPHDRDNLLSNFVPGRFDAARAVRVNPTTGLPVPGSGDPLNGIIIADRNSPWGRRIAQNNTNLLGPRIGFAWAPFASGRTSLRAGYGIYYTRPLLGTFINNSFGNPPFSRSVTIQTPLLSMPSGGVEAAASVPNLTTIGLPVLAPTIQQWSFGIQHEVIPRSVLGVAYVASHGTHLFRPLALNSPPAGAAAAGNPHINTTRPYQGYGSITQRESSASSVYHSMQVTFNRRVSGKLTAGAAYTWGKSIDNASSDRDAGDIPPNSNNARAERGPSALDRTHIFSANYVWHVPSPFRRGVLSALLAGWQFSGITRMWAGRPFDVSLSQDVALIGGTQNQRPNVIADTGGPRTPQQWFNRDAFSRPANGTFGNMGRNSLRGPGVHKWDLSLFKNFTLSERGRLQFRSEFFNAFNHPSFQIPGSNLAVTATGVNPAANSFAVVTDTRDARVLQFALKLSF